MIIKKLKLYKIFLFVSLGNSTAVIPIGIAIQVPYGTYGRIASRSSFAARGIDVGAGVVDADYRGEIKIVLINRSKECYKGKRGNKIAQIIVTKIEYPLLQELNELPPSERGQFGFGSTGK